MRNNPNFDNKLEFSEVFIKQARIEKIRRYFASNKTKVYKHFCIQDYKNNFSKKHLTDYITALDGFMQMQGRLAKSFSIDKYFEHLQDEDEI